MNDDIPRFENEIIGKKRNKIEQDEGRGKKGKNKKKQQSHKQQIPIEEFEERGGGAKKNVGKPVIPEPVVVKKDCEKIFKELCLLLSDMYKEETISKMLKQTDYNKQEAYQRLLMLPPDNQKEDIFWKKQFESVSKPIKKEEQDQITSATISENANLIMNEVFDTLLQEEINGRQFDELFQQIAFMVKEDQKEKGVGMLEINSFVDQCNSISQTLLVGFREEISNFDDFEFDVNSPLYAQIQKFVEDIIIRQVAEQKRQQEDFPSLQTGGNGKRNIVDKIKLQNRVKKQQEYFFTPSRSVLPKFVRQQNSEASIFNVDNRYNSSKDLISLHKEFQDVPIIDLKFIYKFLDGDYNRAVEFLMKHYHLKKKTRLVREIKTIVYPQPVPQAKKIYPIHMREEEIDKELQHLSLEQIREEIDHLYKLRQAFQLTKMKIKNVNQRKELDRICSQNDPLIRKLSQASRVLTIQQMIKKDPLYVDLHGYREEQVPDLLEAVSRMLNQQAQMGSQKVRTRMIRGRRVVCLTVMTGKGIHSKGNRSILKPAVSLWCQQSKVDFDEEADHIKIYLPIK